jgi:hypothetical protein
MAFGEIVCFLVNVLGKPPEGYEVACRQTIIGIFETYSQWVHASGVNLPRVKKNRRSEVGYGYQ